MAEQIPGNFAATTVAAGGYTSGSGVLNVASTASPFPTTGAFSVVVYNQANDPPTPRGILRIATKASATQWTVAAEGADFNALAGDAVYAIISNAALTALLTSGGTAFSALTSATNSTAAMIVGSGASITPSGTGIITASPTSGAVFTPVNNQTSSVTSWQNFSILAAIRGGSLSSYPTSWKVRMRFTAGSPVIGGMKILRTLSRNTSVIDSTTVTIGSVANPTLTTPALVETDAISLATDATHDYWFVIFFTNTGANASVGVVDLGPVNLTSGFASGDNTGVSTIPSITVTNSPYLVNCGINS